MSNSPAEAPPQETASVPRHNGILVIVSSPSGGGKGTLIQRVLKSAGNLGYSVSYTTREPREGETDGREYHFVSLGRFRELIEAGEFLEWAVVHGNYYGTGRTQIRSELEHGRDLILELDVQGAASLRDISDDHISVFIIPPSFEVLKQRLIARGTETDEEVERRLRSARSEMEQFRFFDYVILNDDAERASRELVSVIEAERVRRERQAPLAKAILGTFPADGNLEEPEDSNQPSERRSENTNGR